MDTYGGRVIQILSVQTETMTLQGDAGSRPNLLRLFQQIRNMQMQQIETSAAMRFYLPSDSFADVQNISQIGALNVWFSDISLGWDPTTVTYPYTINFEVQEDSFFGDVLTVGAGNSGYTTLNNMFLNLQLTPGGNFGVGIGFNQEFAGLVSTTGSNSYADLSGAGGLNV